ncbi:class I SAM-dependent methyltransferase [Methanosarcina sp. Z-7115]|uniref:Class I SAM-dependent methyltransferase n=1 Tax=Methanosarcina baikalica TaxID=3073890 RepID=A0ABU2CZC6_9EURY|nr:class I SAM-dependent methyltransferase [Methanosarcina sp. Z-7115]MDR7665090.1 class I SAM-dependent methyltransferase [Methanosarcina sp. Z-7115]
MSPSKFKYDYSTRITKGIIGFPHRKRLIDISKSCSNFVGFYAIDIGCSDLFFDQNIIPNQKTFVGCDANWEDSLRLARENITKYNWNNTHIIKSVVEFLPFIDNFFDLVLCFETLEHVDDEVAAIKEIKRISKDGSLLVISAPIEFGFILFFKQLLRWLVYGSKQYSLKELFCAVILCDLKSVNRVKYSHKGYDYRNTITFLSPEYTLINKINTPFKYLPNFLSYGTILIFRKFK